MAEKSTEQISRGFRESRPQVPDVFGAIGDVISRMWGDIVNGGVDGVQRVITAIKGETGQEIDPTTMEQLAWESTDAPDLTDRLLKNLKQGETMTPGQNAPILGKQTAVQPPARQERRQAPIESWHDVERREIPKKKKPGRNPLLD
jgi:hypothetical protein